MPQMMPIYWFMIYLISLMTLMLLLVLFNSIFIIKMMKFNFSNNLDSKEKLSYKIKWK